MDVQIRGAKSETGQPSVLSVAARVLSVNAGASLSEVAASAGISRTTLHKRYPTRQDLLLATAGEALDSLEAAIADALAAADGSADAALATVGRLVRALVPLGAELTFLWRQPSLDTETSINRRWEELDRPVIAFLGAAQRVGVFRPDLPRYWLVSSLYALVMSAYEGVALGELAPRAAPDLVIDQLLRGAGAPSADSPDRIEVTR